MLLARPNGEGVELCSRPLAAGLTRAQVRARRNEDWRIDLEVGRYDPIRNRLIRRSVSLIALLSGVSVRTVQVGIAEARRLREEIEGAD